MQLYRGPCRVPYCKSLTYARGCCRRCYDEIYYAKRINGVKPRVEMARLGILLAVFGKKSDRRDDPGVSLNFRQAKWLPSATRNALGLHLVDNTIQTKPLRKCPEWERTYREAIQPDFSGVPEEVAERFEDLSFEEWNRLAWTACKWRPGSYERQIVLRLRGMFSVNFRGSGMFHPDDCNDSHLGTMPCIKCEVPKDE